MVLTLQRSLLPHAPCPSRTPSRSPTAICPRSPAWAGTGSTSSPCPAPGSALFVGDVVGHGMLAAATMGRLRTAARNFADARLRRPTKSSPTSTILWRRLDRDDDDQAAAGRTGIIGATCLYAIYDPTSRQCTMARAGHPPPALVHPDGTVTFPDLPAGPPLGLGGLPFETAEIDLPENSLLVLYTDGLIEDRDRDIDEGFDQLRAPWPTRTARPRTPARRSWTPSCPTTRNDDIALLVARTHALDPDRVATWDLPADPALVGASAAPPPASWRTGGWTRPRSPPNWCSASWSPTPSATAAAHPGTADPRPRPDLRGLRQQQHRPAPAPARRHRRGRPRPVPRRAARPGWGTRYTAEGKVIWAECAVDVPARLPGAGRDRLREHSGHLMIVTS